MNENKKELTDRQKTLINALMGQAKGDIREAMKIAGYSENTSIREAVVPIKEEVIEAAQTLIAINSPQAAMSMIGVLTSPSQLGAKNAIAAAKEVLDRAGVIKREKVEVETTGGLFILPAKKSEDD